LDQLGRGNCLLARDGRELPEKLVESLAALQIIEEGLHRYPRADEDRVARLS